MSMSINQPIWLRISNWIDDTFFPVEEATAPALEEKLRIQAQIEADADKIRKCIKTSRTLPHTDVTIHLICGYIRKHRHSGQNNMLKGCVGSLMLDLENKKRELLSKL